MTAQERIASLSTPTWTLAAFAASVESGLVAALDEPREIGELAERTRLAPAVVAALLDVLATMDLAEPVGERWVAGAELEPALRGPLLGVVRDDLRTTLLQAVALAAAARDEPGALGGWQHIDEELLQAPGRLSAGVVPMLSKVLFPHVPGLLDRLASDTGAFLDVGTGVAAVSIAMCRHYPPPPRSRRRWPTSIGRCGPAGCCSPAPSTRAETTPRARSRGCASPCGAASACRRPRWSRWSRPRATSASRRWSASPAGSCPSTPSGRDDPPHA